MQILRIRSVVMFKFVMRWAIFH